MTHRLLLADPRQVCPEALGGRETGGTSVAKRERSERARCAWIDDRRTDDRPLERVAGTIRWILEDEVTNKGQEDKH